VPSKITGPRPARLVKGKNLERFGGSRASETWGGGKKEDHYMWEKIGTGDCVGRRRRTENLRGKKKGTSLLWGRGASWEKERGDAGGKSILYRSRDLQKGSCFSERKERWLVPFMIGKGAFRRRGERRSRGGYVRLSRAEDGRREINPREERFQNGAGNV